MGWDFVSVAAVPTRGATMIVAAPGHGMVGPTAARFLIDELELRLLGFLVSADLPPLAFAWEGVVSGPAQLWGRDGPDGARLLVLNVDAAIPLPAISGFARFVADWSAQLGVGLILVPDGIAVGEGAGEVETAANLPGEAALAAVGGARTHGPLFGLAGALLPEAARHGVAAISVLARADIRDGDAHAALAFLKTAGPLAPSAPLASDRVVATAEAIQERLAAEHERKARAAAEQSMQGYI